MSQLSVFWHGVEVMGPLLSIVGVSHVRNPTQLGPSTQKTYLCDMHGLLLKNILHLAGYQAIHPGQRPHTGVACGEGSDLV